MIESRFVTYTELESFFVSGDIDKIKKHLPDTILIGSTADILYIVEQFQKNNIQVRLDKLNNSFKLLDNDGSFYFPELDRGILLENLFDEDSLWEKPCNLKISPRFSSSLLTIIPNSENCFWSIDVFDQMEGYFLSFESYE